MTKGMKTDKRSDTHQSDLLGREISSLSPCFDWITYPLCDMNQVFNSTGSESMMDVSSAVFKDGWNGVRRSVRTFTRMRMQRMIKRVSSAGL